LANEFPEQVSAPPKKPADDAPLGDRHAWRQQRRRKSSTRIGVEHATAGTPAVAAAAALHRPPGDLRRDASGDRGPGIGSGRASAYPTTGEHRTGARPADRLLIIGHPNRQTSTPPHQSPTESLVYFDLKK
jgi:hypothetical protein